MAESVSGRFNGECAVTVAVAEMLLSSLDRHERWSHRVEFYEKHQVFGCRFMSFDFWMD